MSCCVFILPEKRLYTVASAGGCGGGVMVVVVMIIEWGSKRKHAHKEIQNSGILSIYEHWVCIFFYRDQAPKQLINCIETNN